MAQDHVRLDDLGRCRLCGGRIAATHMLTRTYEVDRAGRWERKIDEFVEDVVVVCKSCGHDHLVALSYKTLTRVLGGPRWQSVEENRPKPGTCPRIAERASKWCTSILLS